MWFRLVAFGSDLDPFEKGDKVLVNGRLSMNKWENRDGEIVTTYEIMVDGAALVSKPKPKAETDLPNEHASPEEDAFPE
jgi:Single-stranded DNA-binding protein